MARRIVTLTCISAALVLAAAHPASAASVEAGWWSSAPAALYPDVPADGLVVQGGPAEDQPLAYAAVKASVAPDATAVRLTLPVAPGSASTPGPALAACSLMGTFQAAKGGSMADAPPFDCAKKSTATPSADGMSYAFDVAALVRNAAVAVAIVPAAFTDRVVFQPPSLDVELPRTTASPASAAPGPTADVAPVDAVIAPEATPVKSLPSPVADVAAAPTSAPTADVAAPTTKTAAGSTALAARARRAAAADDDDSPAPAIAFALLVALAAVLWVSAGRTPEEAST